MNSRTAERLLFILTAILATLALAGCAGTGKDMGRSTENMSLETVYRIGLGNYLSEKLDLDSYESRMAEAGCVPVDPERRREEQLRDRTGTSYIYVRNDIHTERLSPDDIEILKSGQLADDGTLSEEIMEVVERTYPVVLASVDIRTEKYKGKTIIYDMNVLGDTDSYNIPVDALLLQIATQTERDKEGNEVSREKEEEKENLLYDISREIESNSKKLLSDVPVCVRVDFVL